MRIIKSTLRSRTPEVLAQILADLVKNVFTNKGQNVGKVVLTIK